MDCIRNVIGIASSLAASNPPANYNVSESGIFLLDRPESSFLSDSCEFLHLLDKMDQCIASACLDTWNLLMSEIWKVSTKNYPTFKGLVGQPRHNGTVSQSYGKAGIFIGESKSYDESILGEGSYVEVNRIGVMMDTAGDYTVNVYRNEELLSSHVVTALALKPSYLALDPPIRLPMKTNGESYSYAFLVDSGSHMPMANKLLPCSCGSASALRNKTVHRFARVCGIIGSGTDFDTYSTSSAAYGVSLDCELSCDAGSIICANKDSNDQYLNALAMAVYYRSLALFITTIIENQKVSRFNIAKKDQFFGKRNHMNKMWHNAVVDHLAGSTDLTLNACLKCSHPSGMTISTVRL